MITFSKMQALGNDFVVIEGVTQHFYITPEIVKKLANRKTGIGFDQLLLIEPPYSPEIDFHYRIFNADGSEVGQCGNGARCIARFLIAKKLTYKKQIKVSTISQVLTLNLEYDGSVLVEMNAPIFDPKQVPFRAQKEEKNYLLPVLGQTLLASVVSMGNPHCILQTQDLDKVDVALLGAEIETHERFPEKTNVGWMQVVDRSLIKLRVFERGVGETQSCGSCACAAVAVARNLDLVDKMVTVELLGGRLKINWEGKGSSLFMQGEAHHVFDGVIYF